MLKIPPHHAYVATLPCKTFERFGGSTGGPAAPKWLSSGQLRTTFDLGPVADPPKPSYFRPQRDRIPDLPSLFPLEMAPSSQVGLPKRTLIGAQRSSLNSKDNSKGLQANPNIIFRSRTCFFR